MLAIFFPPSLFSSFSNFPHLPLNLFSSPHVLLSLLLSSILLSQWDCVPYMSKPVLAGVWCQLICCSVDRRMAAQHSLRLHVCAYVCMYFCVCSYERLCISVRTKRSRQESKKLVSALMHLQPCVPRESVHAECYNNSVCVCVCVCVCRFSSRSLRCNCCVWIRCPGLLQFTPPGVPSTVGNP